MCYARVRVFATLDRYRNLNLLVLERVAVTNNLKGHLHNLPAGSSGSAFLLFWAQIWKLADAGL